MPFLGVARRVDPATAGAARNLRCGRGGWMFSTLRELLEFFTRGRRLFYLPVLLALLIVATVLVLTEGSVIAPFIYVLF